MVNKANFHKNLIAVVTVLVLLLGKWLCLSLREMECYSFW